MSRIGRRGLLLFALAIMFGLYGISLISNPPNSAFWWPVLQGQLLGIPTDTWGYWWVMCSIVLLLGAPLDRDRVQFSLASGQVGLWAFAALYTNPAPGPGIVYSGLAFIILLCSGWPDPKVPKLLDVEISQVRVPVLPETFHHLVVEDADPE